MVGQQLLKNRVFPLNALPNATYSMYTGKRAGRQTCSRHTGALALGQS